MSLRNLTCSMTSQAAVSCPDIIGEAHSLYHSLDRLDASERAQAMIEIRAALDKLTATVVAVERRLAAEIAAELEEDAA